MKILHIMSVNSGDISFHHTVELPFQSKKQAMSGAVNVVDNLHLTLDIPLVLVTVQNKEVIINETPCNGLLMLSVDLPYGCFIEGASMDSNDLFIYDPTSEPRFQKTIEC